MMIVFINLSFIISYMNTFVNHVLKLVSVIVWSLKIGDLDSWLTLGRIANENRPIFKRLIYLNNPIIIWQKCKARILLLKAENTIR